MLKESFSENQWAALRDAPNWVALAATFAGASGFFGTLSETFAGLKTISEGKDSASALLHELGEKSEITASRDAIQDEFSEEKPDDPREYLKVKAVQKAQQSLAILRASLPDQTAAYRSWLLEIAQNVANSSKEGDFLGFGGERLSDNERAFIAHLEQATQS